MITRRDFLKGAMSLAALGAFARLAGQAGADGDKASGPGAQVTRRKYKDTALALPMLGFGLMRLPRTRSKRPEIDLAETGKLFDRAMKAGVNYFDTAYFYHGGQSERCAGKLLKKYPRESFYLADKMPMREIRTEADLERIWNEQLRRCEVDYFDFYMLHSLSRGSWELAKRVKACEFLRKKQAEGKIRKLGFSFHDSPDCLERIVREGTWDFAQIQLNYLDWTAYRSKEQYEILTKAGIPVIVMEPLKGGALARPNAEAAAVFKRADPASSAASWAFRYAGSLPNVICILSGMSSMAHLEDNIKTFTDFKPLTGPERQTVAAALGALRGATPCTGCRYCVPCPAGVDIPGNFDLYRELKLSGDRKKFASAYRALADDEKASACVSCGACLKKCPQHIDIPRELAKVAAEVRK